MTHNEIIDTRAAAEALGLSYSTLTKMRVNGGGPIFLKLGRVVKYRRADLDTWMTENRRRSTSDNGRVTA